MTPSIMWKVLREAYVNSVKDHVPRLGAALAFYMTFSLAPLLVIVIAIAGLVFGRQAAEGRLIGEIGSLVGDEAARTLQFLISSADQQGSSVVASVMGGLAILLGAIGLFCEVRDALNTVFETPPLPGGGIWNLLRSRLLSFLLILGSAGLLLISLAISTVATAVQGLFAETKFANMLHPLFLNDIHGYVSFGVIVVLFAMIFRFLPDAKISLRDVWFGALITALLFVLGKSLMAYYLGRTAITSFYGAAASIVALMIWNNYTARVFLYGAEITKAYAQHNGRGIVPRNTPSHREDLINNVPSETAK